MPINQDNRYIQARVAGLRIAVLVVFCLFAVQLWRLAVFEHAHYAGLSERNQIRIVPLVGPRGIIYDREGRPLVENVKSIDIVVYRDEIRDARALARFLEEGGIIPSGQLEARLQQYGRYPNFHPVVIREHVGLAEIAYIQSHQTEFPELKIFEEPKRLYRYGSLASHVLGYVGEVSDAQVRSQEYAGSRAGDIVGKFGVERSYNRTLTGVNGQLKVLVNNVGRVKAELERSSSRVGRELTLTLDLDLQMVAEEQMRDKVGALVALDPRNGEVLAMVSKPDFDPNRFAVRIDSSQWRDLLENPDSPLQNRPLQNAFSPGSVFKIIMSLAGLEGGLVEPESSVYCPGGATLFGHYFRCHAGGHGSVDLRKAIVQSCNVYFYNLGTRMGIDTISRYATMTGLGVPTGIDLPGETAGLMPSAEWKERVFHERWYAGETVSVAIGQGAVAITPLQMARAIGGIAMGGYFAVPRVARFPGTAAENSFKAVSHSWDSQHVQFIRDSMWAVVNAGGTGRAAAVPGFDVGGKTGTAQTIGSSSRERLARDRQAEFENNAWFVGFAPRDAPRIALAVLVQRGGYGGQAAAPIAGAVFRAYYEKSLIPARHRRPSPLTAAMK